MTLGDRVAVMRNGVLQQVGSPKELYERPVNLFVAGFIGSPAMNFMACTLEEGMLRTSLGEFRLGDRLRRELEAPGPGGKSSWACGRRTSRTWRWSRPTTARTGSRSTPASTSWILGSDVFVYFTREVGKGVNSAELEELARTRDARQRRQRRDHRRPARRRHPHQRGPATPSSGWTPGRCTSSTRPAAATCRWLVTATAGLPPCRRPRARHTPSSRNCRPGRCHGHRHTGGSRPGRPGRRGYLAFRRSRSMIWSFHRGCG